MQELLEEFVEKTGSLIGKDLLDIWPEPTHRIFKVFPYEYQRALKQMEEEQALKEQNELAEKQSNEVVAISNGNGPSEAVIDIEDVIADADVAQKKLDKIK